MKPNRPMGFTLIEVLIAMTLLSVMVTLLFSSLRTAAQSWNAGENKVAEVNTKAVVYQFFKRHLTTIRPLPMLNNEQNVVQDARQVFQGFTQSLRFAAALPAASARKGLQIFTIVPDPTNTSSLLVSLVPYRQTEADQDWNAERPEVLLENIAQLRFSYFGQVEDMGATQWRDEWTFDRLPSLIKVSIKLADGSYWPEMVFPLKITQSAGAEGFADGDLAGHDLADDVR